MSQVEDILERVTDAVRRNRYDEADALLRDAVDRYPNDPEVRLRWGVAQADVDTDEAKLHLRRAAELAPADAGTQFRVASPLFRLGEVEEALACAKRARDCMDEDFPLLPNLVNLVGRIASAKGQPELAEEALRFAFEVEPELPWHAGDLARVLISRGRKSDAAAVIDIGLRHSPEDPKLLRLRDELRSSRRS